jgi:hypothetical protein
MTIAYSHGQQYHRTKLYNRCHSISQTTTIHVIYGRHPHSPPSAVCDLLRPSALGPAKNRHRLLQETFGVFTPAAASCRSTGKRRCPPASSRYSGMERAPRGPTTHRCRHPNYFAPYPERVPAALGHGRQWWDEARRIR